MNRWVRWGKFNLVGLMGVGVQLGVLAVLARVFVGHYLMATALAIEVAVVHNFVWHQRYTWRERCEGAWWGRMVRFQLSNGAVSLAGNLVLMRVLVQGVGMRVVVANGLAIACCSVMNFGLGDGWAFRKRGGPALKLFEGEPFDSGLKPAADGKGRKAMESKTAEL